MTDKQKLDAVLLLLNPSQLPQKKAKAVRTDTRTYISAKVEKEFNYYVKNTH